jgi:hypothetical protein
MKILNLYAGIGGNRALSTDCQVTAVEYDPRIAAEYGRRFPNDTVAVDDAHEYLKRNFASFDVPTSAGDHVGCAYVPGAIAYCVASTAPVQVENPAATIYVPEYGIMIERKSDGNVATARFNVNAWVGVAKMSASLFPQFKLLSVND